MSAIRATSALVIRCFRRVEHAADWLTGAAGPVFIALAWILTVFIGFAFFDVIAREISWGPTLLLLPLYILVPANMYGQYYLVTHVSPGHPAARTEKEMRWVSHNPRSRLAPEYWGYHARGAPQSFAPPRRVRRCRKCDGPKPERTHHCSVCKRCVLLMDHHCPWINACVGLHNQRHFVLFMMWLAFGASIFGVLGYRHFWRSMIWNEEDWNAVSPRVFFTLAWIMSVAVGAAVLVLGGWHLFMVSRGETSIESHDNEYLEKKAKSEGLVYLNPYDLGKRRNLANFFNVGPGGYPMATLLFPLIVPPYSNGWSWPRRSMPSLPVPDDHVAREGGLVGDGPGGRYVMGGGDELTDDEDGGGGWWPEEAT